jgi:hypothetical protein
MSVVLFDSDLDGQTALHNVSRAAFTWDAVYVAYKIQTLGNYPEENIQHSEHSESLKSRSIVVSLGATRFNI